MPVPNPSAFLQPHYRNKKDLSYIANKTVTWSCSHCHHTAAKFITLSLHSPFILCKLNASILENQMRSFRPQRSIRMDRTPPSLSRPHCRSQPTLSISLLAPRSIRSASLPVTLHSASLLASKPPIGLSFTAHQPPLDLGFTASKQSSRSPCG